MTDHPADEIQRVRVVNRNDFTISDRFDGVPVVFRPNDPVDLPPEVAQHILGYPGDTEDMYRHMAKRWGWNLPANVQTGFAGHLALDAKGVPLWVRQCQKIEIAVKHFELRPVRDPKAPIPADDGAEETARTGADDVFSPPRKTKREVRKERSERMKRLWAERRAKGKTAFDPPVTTAEPSRGADDLLKAAQEVTEIFTKVQAGGS